MTRGLQNIKDLQDMMKVSHKNIKHNIRCEQIISVAREGQKAIPRLLLDKSIDINRGEHKNPAPHNKAIKSRDGDPLHIIMSRRVSHVGDRTSYESSDPFDRKRAPI
jgi:hypothetical protein